VHHSRLNFHFILAFTYQQPFSTLHDCLVPNRTNLRNHLLKHFSITPWQVSLVTFLRRFVKMDHHLPHVNTTSGPTSESFILSALLVLVAAVLFAALLSGPAPAWENEGER
jgi:hypothetical protein